VALIALTVVSAVGGRGSLLHFSGAEGSRDADPRGAGSAGS